MRFRRRPRKLKMPPTTLSLLRDIKAAVLVTMYLVAIIAGSTCDLGALVDFTAELVVEEPNETEADRAMADSTWF